MFKNENEKRKLVLDELKQFTKSSDVYKLANNLNKILKTPEQRELIEGIIPFIPHRHRLKFRSLMLIDESKNKAQKTRRKNIDDLSFKKDSKLALNAVKNESILYNYNPINKHPFESTAQADGRPIINISYASPHSRSETAVAQPPMGKRY